ncbi:unnamed protein product [Penicillium olsonii]|uniref:Acetyl-CoA synthetase-like protein n=1 Tax=Penicillium olsonii TaxID=99116 RepID=A0A9W4MLS1_PENOL|nr:unnamed protein product [Penicillium olsonii]CAG8266055.1 unnamed protein product [Penicillium olsonii]
MANYFQSDIGLRRGAVVGILQHNSVDFPVLVHGILAAGGMVSAFNPFHRSQEICHYLTVARPEIVIVDAKLAGLLSSGLALANLHPVPRVYIQEDSIDNPSMHQLTFNLRHIIQNGRDNFDEPTSGSELESRQTAFICFSSGTSGTMKGVRLTHENIVANIFQHRQRLEGMFASDTVTALITPFFHILGLGVFVCQYLCQVITHINIVPPIALQFLNCRHETPDFSSLRCLINAAAPLQERVSAELSQRMGCKVTQWYGMTEAAPSVISQREDEVGVSGTIGKILPGISIRILDSDGRECTHDQIGEIQIKGPNIMPGYVGGENLNSTSFVDGYLKTGDIGRIDQNGYVFLKGRAKEMIKVKGNQVAPAELEAILLSHPKVDDAAVEGIFFEDEATEYPAAYIVTADQVDNYQTLQREVQTYVDNQVAAYKHLRGGVNIVASIPRNASGKILRNLLAETPKLSRSLKL